MGSEPGGAGLVEFGLAGEAGGEHAACHGLNVHPGDPLGRPKLRTQRHDDPDRWRPAGMFR